MSKFRKENSKSVPGVNTSSLPDIVFMLLFFFMVATTTKESDPTVKVERPIGVKATDLTPYKQRSEIDFQGQPNLKKVTHCFWTM
jgi:biopolymer transport protein ExbD